MKNIILKTMIAGLIAAISTASVAFDSTSCGNGNFREEIGNTHEFRASDIESNSVDVRATAAANYLLNTSCNNASMVMDNNVQYAKPELTTLVKFDLYIGGLWELRCGRNAGPYLISIVQREDAPGLMVGLKHATQGKCFNYLTWNQEREILKKYSPSKLD